MGRESLCGSSQDLSRGKVDGLELELCTGLRLEMVVCHNIWHPHAEFLLCRFKRIYLFLMSQN